MNGAGVSLELCPTETCALQEAFGWCELLLCFVQDCLQMAPFLASLMGLVTSTRLLLLLLMRLLLMLLLMRLLLMWLLLMRLLLMLML
jgi:hypothetical protein